MRNGDVFTLDNGHQYTRSADGKVSPSGGTGSVTYNKSEYRIYKMLAKEFKDNGRNIIAANTSVRNSPQWGGQLNMDDFRRVRDDFYRLHAKRYNKKLPRTKF